MTLNKFFPSAQSTTAPRNFYEDNVSNLTKQVVDEIPYTGVTNPDNVSKGKSFIISYSDDMTNMEININGYYFACSDLSPNDDDGKFASIKVLDNTLELALDYGGSEESPLKLTPGVPEIPQGESGYKIYYLQIFDSNGNIPEESLIKFKHSSLGITEISSKKFETVNSAPQII